jgi:hypothetical protein
VGKVIAVGPGGKPQAPQRSDYFRGVIDYVRGAGLLDQLLLSPRCRGHEHADEVRRGLYLSARYYCSCGDWLCTRKHANVPGEANPGGGCPRGGQRISCRAEVVTVTGGDGRKRYHVQFRLHDKREAIRAIVAKYGPDTSKWPYLAKAKHLKEH